jgi:hypothetical protein
VPEELARAQRIAVLLETSPEATPKEKPLGFAAAAGESANSATTAAARESDVRRLRAMSTPTRRRDPSIGARQLRGA